MAQEEAAHGDRGAPRPRQEDRKAELLSGKAIGKSHAAPHCEGRLVPGGGTPTAAYGYDI